MSAQLKNPSSVQEAVARIRDWTRPGYVYLSERGRIADVLLVIDAAERVAARDAGGVES